MRCEMAGWALAGLVLGPSAVHAQAPEKSCDRLAVGGVLPGMTYEEVRRKLGNDEAFVTDEGAGPTRKSAVAYRVPPGIVYVRYDRALSSKGSPRVELVRSPLPQTLTAVAGLVARLGEPSVGADFLVRGLDQGPAVWIDDRCNLVLTYHRRQESWWAEDVGAFLQLETLEDVRAGGSPATAAVAGYQADGHAAAPDAAPIFANGAAQAEPVKPSEPEKGAVRVEYVPPVYPSAAKMLRMKGRVTVKLRIRVNGSVGDAVVVEAQPPGRGFEEAALDAARQWHYEPAKRDGRPVESEVLVVLDFR